MYASRSDIRRPCIRLNALRAHFIGVDTAQTEKRKRIEKGLETVRCCFKTRYFYADCFFLILKLRFSLGEIVLVLYEKYI